MIAVTKKRPRALAGAGAAENRNQRESYSDFYDLQAAGLDSAALTRDAEERFLSALWHSLPAGRDEAPALGIDRADLFAFAEHRHLFQVLMLLGERGFSEPREALVLAVLRGAFSASLFQYDDQLSRIRWAESSAAGLESWARWILRAHRRRVQISRLWRALRDRVADPLGEGARRAAPTAPKWTAKCGISCARFGKILR